LLRIGHEDRKSLELLVALLIFLTALAQLWINHPKTWEQNSRLLLLLSTMILHLGIIKLMLEAAVAQVKSPLGGLSPSESYDLWTLAVPYAFGPLLLSVLLGRNHGIFTAIYVSLWGSMFGSRIDPAFLVSSLICGFIAVFVTLNVRRRSRLIRAGVFVGLATLLLAMLFGRMGFLQLAGFTAVDWKMAGLQALMAVGSGIVTAFLISGSLPDFREPLRHHHRDFLAGDGRPQSPAPQAMMIEAPGTVPAFARRRDVVRSCLRDDPCQRHHGARLQLLSRYRQAPQAGVFHREYAARTQSAR
jgi:membrane-associated HD superfamily phosphohydrolase